jgi:hypothetical protein
MMRMAGSGTFPAGGSTLLTMLVIVHGAFIGTHAAYFLTE